MRDPGAEESQSSGILPDAGGGGTTFLLTGIWMREARTDAQRAKRDVLTREAGGQLLRAAGSIAANIAEGYSRGTTADRRKFYEYALGSVRECLVWYETLPASLPESRIERLVSIRRLLLTMIRNAREDTGADRGRFTR